MENEAKKMETPEKRKARLWGCIEKNAVFMVSITCMLSELSFVALSLTPSNIFFSFYRLFKIIVSSLEMK
jgi:hypothetical protein